MIKTKADLLEYLAADKKALGRKGKKPKYNDLIWKYEVLLRKCEYYSNVKRIFGRVAYLFYRWRRFRLGIKTGFSIPLNTCSKGLCLAHIGPVIISNYAQIGEYCRIHVGVNIGADARDGKAAPKIGEYVYIAPGAKLFGNIEIADRIAVGANSVVNKSFLTPNVSIAGAPARLISDKGSEGIIKF